ncbi:ABC transporter substrate-binding protein [Cupriavidus basilensis]
MTRNHAFMIYDTLFSEDAQNRPQPQMVEKFTSNADATVWEFTLRPGLKFSDGKPITSADVIASLQRWGKRDSTGQKMMAALKSFDASNERTFKMTFNSPFGAVPEVLAKSGSNVAFIMPKRVAETPADQQISEYVGSGPFMFQQSEYRPGSRVVYVKNPYYLPRSEPASGMAGGKLVKVDRVEWVILKDSQTQINALKNGEVDLVEQVPGDQYSVLKTEKDIALTPAALPNLPVAHFNHAAPPFDNPKIVKAAILAINQDALLRAQALHKENYKPCLSVFPCGTPYASDKAEYFTGKPQFEKARALLKEASYDGTPVVVMAPTDLATITKYPLVYAALLKQAGFNVDLQSMDWGTLLTRRAKKTGWGVFITAWGGSDALNPGMYGALTGNGEKGYFGWPEDATLEELKSQFLASKDDSAKKALADQIQQRIFDGALVGPMGNIFYHTAARKDISGMLKTPLVVYWNVEKK